MPTSAINRHDSPEVAAPLVETRNGDFLMTEKEAAEFLRFSPKTLRNWRYEGVGPDFEKAGRSVRYKRSALNRWLKTHRPEDGDDGDGNNKAA